MTNRFVGKPQMRRGSFGVTSPASPRGRSPISRPPPPPYAAPPDHPHGLGTDRGRETAIAAMVITTAAVPATAAVNFLSAIRR